MLTDSELKGKLNIRLAELYIGRAKLNRAHQIGIKLLLATVKDNYIWDQIEKMSIEEIENRLKYTQNNGDL